jgi:hexosaminidase
LLARSFLTEDLSPVSRNLSQVAAIGLQALNDLKDNRRVSAEEHQRNVESLKAAAKPQAVLLLMVVSPVQKLVEATTIK